MIGRLVELTEQAPEPITAEAFRQFKRIDLSADDQLIDLCIRTARFHAEKYTGRAFITRQFSYFLQTFPGSEEIKLPRSPLVTLDSIEYTNDAGSPVEIDAADYYYSELEPTRIKPVNGWPSTKEEAFDTVEITFTAGYGVEDRFIPEQIKLALLFYAAYLYDNREPVNQVGIPGSVKSALSLFKVR